MIEHVYKRVSKIKNKKKIVITTSTDVTDDRLCVFLKKKKIEFYRGDLCNVASRMVCAAENYKENFFMRISGDSPLIEPSIIDKMINIFNEKKIKPDLLSNVYPKSLPSGQSVEIIKKKLLKKYLVYFSNKEKEHVTKYFYKRSNIFNIVNIKFPKPNLFFKQSVDTKIDLKKIIKKIRNKKITSFKLL